MPVNSFIDYPMSWKPDRSELKRPVYLSLAAKLEEDILSGALTPGTKLPPQRELADFLDINFTTVTRAYRICEQKGLLYGKTGSGTFVTDTASPDPDSSALRGGHLIDLATLSSFEGCHAMIRSSAKKTAGRNYFPKLLNEADPAGMLHHRQAALQWAEPFGVRAEEEDPVIVSGKRTGLLTILTALFEPGDRIAVDEFTDPVFLDLAEMLRLHPVPVQGDPDGMLPDALERSCRQEEIKGVCLSPTCSDPAAAYIPHQRKQELAEVIENNHLCLVESDDYAFLAAGILPDYECPLSMMVPDQSVYLCGTSMALAPGLGVAYAFPGSAVRERFLKTLARMNGQAPSLNAEIACELITSGWADVIMEEKKELLAERNRIFDDLFPEMPAGRFPGFFRRLPLPPESLLGGMEGQRCEGFLQTAGIRVCHSDRFRVRKDDSSASLSERFLRISLSSATTPRLKAGLQILKRELTR